MYNVHACPTWVQDGSQLLHSDVTLPTTKFLYKGQAKKIGGQSNAGQQGDQGIDVHHRRTAVPKS